MFVDSDWAGDKRTRKSTSGGIVVWHKGLIKSWSRTQGSVALSSGEAEFYAAIKGIAEGLGIQSLLKDMGVDVRLVIHQDSTAAKGTLSRSGIGKIKHLDTQWLWSQELVKAGKLELKKVDGTKNPADILTKPSSISEANRRMGMFTGYRTRERTRTTGSSKM